MAVTDLGENRLKNIPEPMKMYALQVGTSAMPERGPTEPAGTDKPDKPSVAVLPFTNMSGDAEQVGRDVGVRYDQTDLAGKYLFRVADLRGRCRWGSTIPR